MSTFKISDEERRVGGFRNIATLTGFVSHLDKDKQIMRLMMSDNEALSVPIHLRANDKVRLHSPVTVYCHVFGFRDKDGQAYSEAHAIRIERPTTLAMPTVEAWYGVHTGAGAADDQKNLERAARAKRILESGEPEDVGEISADAKKQETAFRPFLSSGKLRGLLNDAVDGEPASVEDANMKILADIVNAGGYKTNTANGGNNNIVILVGIVDSMVVVPATEYRRAHGIVFLRQHEDSAKSIPIWIVGEHFRANMKSMIVGMPIWVLGQARNKVRPKDDGDESIIDEGMHVRFWQARVADLKTDMSFTPTWWRGMADRIMADAAARTSATDAAKSIADKMKAEKSQSAGSSSGGKMQFE